MYGAIISKGDSFYDFLAFQMVTLMPQNDTVNTENAASDTTEESTKDLNCCNSCKIFKMPNVLSVLNAVILFAPSLNSR